MANERASEGIGINRTGLAASEHADDLLRDVESFTPMGTESELRDFHAQASADAPPIGSLPPAASFKGAAKQALGEAVGRPAEALLDKLGERLAFERSGTRLYEALVMKRERDGGFPGGPTRDELMEIRDDEERHFHLLAEAIEERDGDPTAVTPSADLSSLMSSGVQAVIADPRTTLAECLEAILVAELVDEDAWTRLVDLAREAGDDDLGEELRSALEDEQRHLALVRSWVDARAKEAS